MSRPAADVHPPSARAATRLAALCCALSAVAAAGAATIEGQVFDQDGTEFEGLTVTVLERTGGGLFSSVKGPEKEQEIARATTDRHGFFRIDLGPRRLKGNYLVRCYDAQRWDRVRHGLPADRLVTGQLEDSGRAIVACVVPDAPGWTELAREIARVGGSNSDRGRILRAQGMPPETFAQNDGLVEWRYPGVTYAFRDGALVDTRRTAGDAR